MLLRRRRSSLLKFVLVLLFVWISALVYYNTTSSQGIQQLELHLPSSQALRPPITVLFNTRWQGPEAGLHPSRDRQLQNEVWMGQEKLKKLLSEGSKQDQPKLKYSDEDLKAYDEQTQKLIKVGLIIPKWNNKDEEPEHPGAPGE